jgi:NAD(P)-dependent dehydrogenase (short-subunit alcohol dehydrogenase family)
MEQIFDIREKVIVITGATGLIGKNIVDKLSEKGAKIVAVDIDESKLQSLTNPDKEIRIKKCNVADSKEVSNLLSFVMDSYGRADVLINNHQYKPQGFLEAQADTFPEELWDSIINVNLKGTFLTCRDFGALMIKQGKGSIINFASTYGIVSSNPDLYEGNSMGNPVAYSASKGGVIMLTKYLGVYWAPKGVRVNAITPHGVWNNHEDGFEVRFSKMSPINRMMNVNEVTGGIIFLASDASSYMTGNNLILDGGWSSW